MLSDACFDFLDTVDRAAQQLAEEVERYSAPPFRYDEDEIDALRRACSKAHADLYNEDAMVDLLRFAALAMRFHDALPDTGYSLARQADMHALVRRLREQDENALSNNRISDSGV